MSPRGANHCRWAAAFLGLSVACCLGADWVRPGISTNQPVWGIRGGLLWAVPPAGFRPTEPRGLIRLGYPTLPGGQYDLINFIAIEPIVRGRRGFSELERSALDARPGKRIWAVRDVAGSDAVTNLVSGRLRVLPGSVEELEVTLGVEQFDNGARVRLIARQRSDQPDELALGIEAEPDSAPLEYCILTATMGNMARTRMLWLKDEVISSLRRYADHRGNDFTPHAVYPRSRLLQTAAGDVLAAVTTDEENPSAVFPFPNSRMWHYGGLRVTQYWRAPTGSIRDDLEVAVNARYTYWLSKRPIPGGIAFENFELRERFHAGQTFIFGITRKTPVELGFRGDPPR